MRASRRSRDEGTGWLATLSGAALLMVLGFGIGLLAGAAYEEPDLVMEHLRGRTTEVPLVEAGNPEAGAGTLAAAVEPPPAGPTPAVELPAARTRRATEPSATGKRAATGLPPSSPQTPAVASAPPSAAPVPVKGGFSVQVGAFGERSAAGALTRELRQLGFAAGVYEESGSAAYKVRVGPVGTREEAERLASTLKREHRLPTWVVSQDPR